MNQNDRFFAQGDSTSWICFLLILLLLTFFISWGVSALQFTDNSHTGEGSITQLLMPYRWNSVLLVTAIVGLAIPFLYFAPKAMYIRIDDNEIELRQGVKHHELSLENVKQISLNEVSGEALLVLSSLFKLVPFITKLKLATQVKAQTNDDVDRTVTLFGTLDDKTYQKLKQILGEEDIECEKQFYFD
ncbi:MAG: hypothetical protein ABEJ65_07785 [bacterium]